MDGTISVAPSSSETELEDDRGNLYRFGPNNIAVNGGFNSDLTNYAGTNWAWQTDGAGGGWARHTAGNASVMASTLPAITGGVSYVVTFTMGGRTAGQVRVNIGGTSGTFRQVNGTYTEILVATNTTTLRAEPLSAFDGYIDNISIVAL